MSLAVRLGDLATREATEFKALRTLLNGNTADLSSLNTTAKNNIVAAINEVLASAGVAINDTTASGTAVYSSNKVVALLAALKAEILGSASAAYDTLQEIQALMAADDTETTGILTALSSRVRTDTAAQGLDATQQSNARTNIAAASAATLATLTTNIGDTDTDFVAIFNAGLI